MVVEGDGDTSQALLAQGFDHVLFTGGTEIGRKIMAAAAPTLTPVTLELGGKSPVYVAADADLGVAARRIAWVKLMNSGQTCIAPDYVLVERSVRDRFVETLLTSLAEFRAETPDAGQPIVNERQYERLTRLPGGDEGHDRRRRQSVDGRPHDPAHGHPRPRSGRAGHVRGDLRPAAAGAHGRRRRRGHRVRQRTVQAARRVRVHGLEGRAAPDRRRGPGRRRWSSTTSPCTCWCPQLPFGGVGDSGMGAYHGEWGF